jgi:hypothetical protein
MALYIESLYYEMFENVIKASRFSHIPKGKTFSFKDYPAIDKRADAIISRATSKLIGKINANIEWAWKQANKKTDTLIDGIFARHGKTPPASIFNDNNNLLAELQSRKINGFTLSDRVWDYNKNPNLKNDIQELVNYALKEGKSAQQLSRDVRQYLKNPDALFRRIRDKNGNLTLSPEALRYNPGRGVYRSAYKNAMRLAREEINRAYRESEWERWQQTPFVIGYRVVTSNRVATVCLICLELAGVYPKSFKFLGWHIQCICHCEAILCTDNEFDRILRNKSYSPKQPNMPDNFKKYQASNSNNKNLRQ